MNPLDTVVRQARRRLLLNVLLRWAVRGLLFAAGAAMLALVIVRLFVPGAPLGWVLVGCGLAGAIVTLVGTLMQRPAPLTAAVAVDQAVGLKERISTALLVRQMGDPFARAVVRDAERQAGRIHVPAHLPLRAPDAWPWSLAVLCSAVLLYLLMPQFDLLAGREREPQPETDVQQVALARQQIETALASKVRKIEQLAQRDPQLKELADVLKPLDVPDKPDVKPQDVRREALKRVDKIAETLRKRTADPQVQALAELRRRLAALETSKGKDEVSKLNRALAAGDTQAARQALAQLKQQIRQLASRNDPEARAKLAELQKKLDELAAKLNKLADSKYLEKELARKTGLSQEQARKLLKQLEGKDLKQIEQALQKQLADKGLSQKQIQQLAQKIARQQKAQKMARNLAQAMSQSAAACKNAAQGGDGASSAAQQAAAALDSAGQQLSEMEAIAQLAAEIEAELEELSELREGLCRGVSGRGKKGKIGRQGPQYGLGRGRRIGEKRVAHGYRKTRVRGARHPGQIIGQMVVDAPLVKGQVQTQVREVVEASVREADDAIERERIPQQYQRVIRNYYRNRKALALQKLSEHVTELYLARGAARRRRWDPIPRALVQLGVPGSRIEHLRRQAGPELLARLVKELWDRP